MKKILYAWDSSCTLGLSDFINLLKITDVRFLWSQACLEPPPGARTRFATASGSLLIIPKREETSRLPLSNFNTYAVRFYSENKMNPKAYRTYPVSLLWDPTATRHGAKTPGSNGDISVVLQMACPTKISCPIKFRWCPIKFALWTSTSHMHQNPSETALEHSQHIPWVRRSLSDTSVAACPILFESCPILFDHWLFVFERGEYWSLIPTATRYGTKTPDSNGGVSAASCRWPVRLKY